MTELERGVTKEQFLNAVLNNELNHTNKELAKDLGISESMFYRLQREYKIESKAEVKSIIERYVAELIGQLRRNARKGSDRAIQLLLEMGDKYTPANKVDLSKKLIINYNIGSLKVPENAGTGKLPNQPQVPIESSEQSSAHKD